MLCVKTLGRPSCSLFWLLWLKEKKKTKNYDFLQRSRCCSTFCRSFYDTLFDLMMFDDWKMQLRWEWYDIVLKQHKKKNKDRAAHHFQTEENEMRQHKQLTTNILCEEWDEAPCLKIFSKEYYGGNALNKALIIHKLPLLHSRLCQNKSGVSARKKKPLISQMSHPVLNQWLTTCVPRMKRNLFTHCLFPTVKASVRAVLVSGPGMVYILWVL